MIKEEIKLFELAASQYGLVISPMLPSFTPDEGEVFAFDLHRHDYHGLFLLASGVMTMSVEGHCIDVKASSILLVPPGQVHQCLHTESISGWIMFFDGKFLDNKARAIVEQSNDHLALFQLSNDEFSFFDQILLSIYQAAEDKMPGNFQTQIIHALTNAVFYKAANMHLLREEHLKASTSRAAQIVQDYKDLIKLKFRDYKRPAAYATLLHISVSYLNDSVKTLTGYSATHILQQEVIGEAQKQLRYTSKAIKEIAFGLGYADYKYFIRLFSKIVGTSPSNFRKSTKNAQQDQKHVLVFKTDVTQPQMAHVLLSELLKLLPGREINFDLDDCDRILRIKGINLNTALIRQILNNHGHACEEFTGDDQ